MTAQVGQSAASPESPAVGPSSSAGLPGEHPLTGNEWMLPARQVMAIVLAALATTVLLVGI